MLTKSKDGSKNRGETSKQRAERMYQEWKMREEKIAKKRREIEQEEDKLKNLATLQQNSEARKNSVSRT